MNQMDKAKIMGLHQNRYYVYAFIRDGIVYHIGKGSGNRAYSNRTCETIRPPIDKHKNVIFIRAHMLEHDAYELEKKIVSQFGRICNGTGCLENRLTGGEIGYK